MPTYTYRCGNCEFRFDHVQRFDDPNPDICPKCGHLNDLQRVYKPVGVVFKGSGFYATDHKSASGISTNGSKPAESSNGSEPAAAAAGSTPAPAASEKPASGGA